jgi:hypothetical protein
MEDAVSTINSDERVLYSMAVSAPLKMLLNLYSIPGIEEYAVTSLEEPSIPPTKSDTLWLLRGLHELLLVPSELSD